jgi:hypothetical protein
MTVQELLHNYLAKSGIDSGKLSESLTDFLAENTHLIEDDPTNPDSIYSTYDRFLIFDTITLFNQIFERPTKK